MAERYHFRLVGPDEVIEDNEGVLVYSIGEAASEAAQIIAELCARDELPDPSECWRVEIHDVDSIVLRSFLLF